MCNPPPPTAAQRNTELNLPIESSLFLLVVWGWVFFLSKTPPTALKMYFKRAKLAQSDIHR